MKALAFYSIAALSALLSACASKLYVFDEKRGYLPGVPVSTPKLVKITTTTFFELAPDSDAKFKELCNTPEIEEKFDYLPTGEISYISFDPATWAKGEFKLELGDNGSLKTISINSDATSGVSATNDLLKTVLPYAASPKPTASAQAMLGAPPIAAADRKAKYCLKKKSTVELSKPN